ncbi:hypothetical protein ACV9MC_004378 [Klebsiella pneumoniae]
MNTLEQLVNQRVLEEGLKKAKPLAAQMGLESALLIKSKVGYSLPNPPGGLS